MECCKYDKDGKAVALNLTTTEPRLIKVTNTAAETISGERKVIENAKTGKVTAVVAVMYLNGKTKVKLCSANSQKSEILIGPERPLVLSERLIVPERLSGSSSTLVRVGTPFSWRKDPPHASPL
jgi:hypothetical protein